jgi:carbamoyltransferase
MEHCYLGPGYTSAEIRALLRATGIRAEDFASRGEALASEVAERLAKGKVVGWFQGRMEFGPRALGARSILGDPCDPAMRDRINARVKRRAPSVATTRAAGWRAARAFLAEQGAAPA